MKRIRIKEEWCLGCHLCEFYCTYANSCSGKHAMTPLDMAKIMKDRKNTPKICVEGDSETGKNTVNFAVNCRHCSDPICVKSCIAGAISKDEGGIVSIDKSKCVGCCTCILVCPYGSLMLDEEHGTMTKCELCAKNSAGSPACVGACPNRAIVLEEVE